MSTKNPFNQVHEFYLNTRDRIILFKEKYPERVIGIMFLILLVAVTIFLISKASHENIYKGSAKTLFKRISAPTGVASGKPATTHVIGLLSLYGKANALNPDSLTLRDSLLLKEINKDLKQILK